MLLNLLDSLVALPGILQEFKYAWTHQTKISVQFLFSDCLNERKKSQQDTN